MTAAGDGPHVLFYGHYDVQPVDPLDLWTSPPFEPRLVTMPDGEQADRRPRRRRRQGPADDLRRGGARLEGRPAGLPVKVSMLFEGEEESGSANLAPFLEQNAAELRADIALVCDTGMWRRDGPAITTMLRGLVGEEVDRDRRRPRSSFRPVRRRRAQSDPRRSPPSSRRFTTRTAG